MCRRSRRPAYPGTKRPTGGGSSHRPARRQPIVDRLNKEISVDPDLGGHEEAVPERRRGRGLSGPGRVRPVHRGGDRPNGERSSKRPTSKWSSRNDKQPCRDVAGAGGVSGSEGSQLRRAGPGPLTVVPTVIRYCPSHEQEFSMKLEFRNNKDFWAGMMLIGIGAAAMFIARDYRFGSALRMGPGFFPTILGGILIAVRHLHHGRGAAQRREDPRAPVAPGPDPAAPLPGPVRRPDGAWRASSRRWWPWSSCRRPRAGSSSSSRSCC